MTPAEIKNRQERILKALESGNCQMVEFSGSGSAITFRIKEEDESTTSITLVTQHALHLLSGYRFKQHECKTCF